MEFLCSLRAYGGNVAVFSYEKLELKVCHTQKPHSIDFFLFQFDSCGLEYVNVSLCFNELDSINKKRFVSSRLKCASKHMWIRQKEIRNILSSCKFECSDDC